MQIMATETVGYDVSMIVNGRRYTSFFTSFASIENEFDRLRAAGNTVLGLYIEERRKVIVDDIARE